jgi:RNA recognition motif-containing protein
MALREAFEAYGAVDSARVIHDRETGRSRGFGFIEMPNQEEAQAALDGMEGKDLMGRPIRCNESQPRRVQSVGELVVCRPSRSLIPALGTPVGAQ